MIMFFISTMMCVRIQGNPANRLHPDQTGMLVGDHSFLTLNGTTKVDKHHTLRDRMVCSLKPTQKSLTISIKTLTKAYIL